MDMTEQENRRFRRSGEMALCAIALAACLAGWKLTPRMHTANASGTGEHFAQSPRPPQPPLPENMAHTTPMPASPLQAMSILDEAPSQVRALHRSVVTDPAGRDVGAEAHISSAFIANTALAASSLSVTCTADRCEVLGATVRDETAAQLALRRAEFLDAVEQFGYTVGTNMTSGRGRGSELIVYLDRVR